MSTPLDQVLNEHEAAVVLRLSVHTLRKYRHQRRGPTYRKLGSRVVYLAADLHDFLEDSVILTENPLPQQEPSRYRPRLVLSRQAGDGAR
jgi:hypothetical protein